MQASALESGRNNMQGVGIALGIIISVDTDKRFCQVKTFMGGPGFEDLHLPQVQWLSTDSNPEGDESTCIPRVGATGLVFFVEGEAFIWGYFRATDPTAGAVTGNEPSDLLEGDKVISTVAGNKVVVKSNGVIEIHSRDSLRTIYFPKDGLLSTLCRAYSFESDAYDVKARLQNAVLQSTLTAKEYRRDIGRTSIVVEERGYVDSTVVKKVAIGPGIPGVSGVQIPVFQYTTDITGKVDVEVGVLGTGVTVEVTPGGGFKMANLLASAQMSESGDWKFDNLLASVEMTAAGDLKAKGPTAEGSMDASGNIEVKNTVATIRAATSGEVTVDAPGGSVKISVAGEVTVDANAKVVVNALAGIDLDTKGPLNITALGPVTIKGVTVAIDGGTGSTNQVLSFPDTVSQFTGTPLVPFSTTVSVSK